MRPISHFSALILCVLAMACATSAETLTGRVVSIADGDTITVLQNEKEIKVRLHGVDTPESGQDFGNAAKEFTAAACFGKELTVVVTDEDRYNRKVGIVVLKDGRVLNHELLAVGFAHYYREYAPNDEALKRLEADAKAAKRGLWSRPDVVTPEEFRRGKGKKAPPFNPPSAAPGVKSPLDATAAPGTVYLTETGSKYHRERCRTLKAGKKAVPRADAEKQGFGPCGICKP